MIAYSAVPHIIASGAISLILSEQADVQVKLSVMQKVEQSTKYYFKQGSYSGGSKWKHILVYTWENCRIILTMESSEVLQNYI
jgi:hypothetical protein